MIVKLDKDGCLGIPSATTTEVVNLFPGYNEISDVIWNACRPNALGPIETGLITEELVKVKEDAVEGYVIVLPSDIETETTKRLVPAKLSDIDRKGNKVINVIKGTYHLPTLIRWGENDIRQDVRIEIQKQIAGIENGTIKG